MTWWKSILESIPFSSVWILFSVPFHSCSTRRMRRFLLEQLNVDIGPSRRSSYSSTFWNISKTATISNCLTSATQRRLLFPKTSGACLTGIGSSPRRSSGTTIKNKKAPLELHKPPWWNQGLRSRVGLFSDANMRTISESCK